MPGLAAACLGELGRPLRLAARHVGALGYRVGWVDLAGSGGAERAALIRAAILELPTSVDRPLVVLGYSKGASDLWRRSTTPRSRSGSRRS